MHILITEDDAQMRGMLARFLSGRGHEVEEASGGTAALERLAAGPVDVVLTDVRMPEMDGVELTREIKRRLPEVAVVVMTAFGSVQTAVEAMRAGATDYLSKPFKMEEVELVLDRIEEERNLRRRVTDLQRQVEERFQFSSIIGQSPAMRRVFELIEQVAPTRSNVLITGASGTGKELVARAIHYNSPRRTAPFVPVNCSAIPEQLLESELFGHVKGAFTGAERDKKGIFEEAAGGTVFLDEIGDMDEALQVKLLRVIQEREVRRVGSNRTVGVDFRVIAATHRDLEAEMAEGRFREDLYYRLGVITIALPPLAARREDIPLLARHFLAKHAQRNQRQVTAIDPQAMRRLLDYDWPGNVRELENVIERGVVLARGDTITEDVLPEKVTGAAAERLGLGEITDLPLAELERRHILATLERHNWHRVKVSEVLGIDRRTLYRKIKEYGFEPSGSTGGRGGPA
ncbi:MAG: sigma-54-dependent Fis family transcriptional regulator [Nitrospirae bacterium]|nr:MAG: sigma-54-dependent Fis family transcriptional regulator [Nitrospirota bacterium]